MAMAKNTPINSRFTKAAYCLCIALLPAYSHGAGLIDGLLQEVAKSIQEGIQQPSPQERSSSTSNSMANRSGECNTNSPLLQFKDALRPNPGEVIEISLDTSHARQTLRGLWGTDGIFRKIDGDKVCKQHRARMGDPNKDSSECIPISGNGRRIDNSYIKPTIAGKLYVQNFPVGDAEIFLTYADFNKAENRQLKFKLTVTRLLKEDNDIYADNCQYIAEFAGFSDEQTTSFIKTKSAELNVKNTKEDAERRQKETIKKDKLQEMIQQVSPKTKIPPTILAAPIALQIGGKAGITFVEYLNAIIKDKESSVSFEISGKQYLVHQKIADRLKGTTSHIDYQFNSNTYQRKDGKTDADVLLERLAVNGVEATMYEIPTIFTGMISRYADTLRETAAY